MLKKLVISRDTYSIIQPLIFVARIFGLCPVSCNEEKARLVLRWSIPFAVYSYLLSTSCITATVVALMNDLQMDESKSYRMVTKKGRIITTCDMSIVILIVIFGTITLPYRMKNFWKLLVGAIKIENVVPQLNFRKYRRNSIIFIGSVYFLFTIVMVFDITYWVRTSSLCNKSGSQYVLNYMGYYILYYILITQEIFFWHLIYVININLILLNEYLVIEKHFPEQEICTDIALMKQQIDVIYTKTFMKNYMRSNVDFKKKYSSLGNNVNRMNILGNFYKIISDAVEVVNGTMANGTMLLTLSCLTHLVITPYFLIAEFMKMKGNTLFMFLLSFWIIVHIGRLLILVEPCHRCSREGQRTTTLICDLLRLSNIEGDFKTAINSFNAQVAQKPIQFSCSGLFPIDRSIITSIAGSVTTYIVIVFQFRN